jgi:hypothetical protein
LEETEFISVSGEVLNPDLIHFTEMAKINRQKYFDSVILSGNTTEPIRIKRICVTLAERQDDESIHNQTKEVIITRIENSLERIESDEKKQNLSKVFESIRSKTKDALISFYSQIQNEISEEFSDSDD